MLAFFGAAGDRGSCVCLRCVLWECSRFLGPLVTAGLVSEGLQPGTTVEARLLVLYQKVNNKWLISQMHSSFVPRACNPFQAVPL